MKFKILAEILLRKWIEPRREMILTDLFLSFLALVFLVLVAFLIYVNCKSQQNLDAYAQDCELITENQPMIAHRCNCSSFIICTVNPPVLMSCPAGLHFNQKIQVCDYKLSAKCVPKTGCPPS